MASPVTHFTHQIPGHYLKLSSTDTFYCGACKERGSGSGYRCSSCSFTLHRSCATMVCEQVITFFMHPKHALTLLTEHSHQVMDSVSCDLCGDRIRGMWYRCAACNFDVHPVCVQIPHFIADPVHPSHKLRFAAGHLGTCDVCKGSCREWHYRCDGCGFDSHMECLHGVSECRDRGPEPEPPVGAGDGEKNGKVRRMRKRDVVGELVLKLGAEVLSSSIPGIVTAAAHVLLQ